MPEVMCPQCEKIRTIKGTEERVRCSSNSCDRRFYVKPNIHVPLLLPKKDNFGTVSKQIIKPEVSIGDLRSMYRHIFYKDPPHNSTWNKKKIVETIIKELGML